MSYLDPVFGPHHEGNFDTPGKGSMCSPQHQDLAFGFNEFRAHV
jgi:hypothetical protein